MDKKKLSAFEFVIMQIADPEKAEQYEPLTRDQERLIRVKNMEKKLSTKIKCRDGSLKPLADCLPLTDYEKRILNS